MKIAVWINKNYTPHVGGGFSYYEKLISTIDNYSFKDNIEVVFVTHSKNINDFKKTILYLPETNFKLPLIKKILYKILSLSHFLRIKINNKNKI